ncbi:Aromatic prenyltransferase 1, UbiA family [hydrothermal vent metagenome]|uniref:Aromatic prenyltransferase 1, UbiA family n=1 Tax=hydrothermal vent metagenome TaxID=652676 RepID=A0A3B0WG36_9ZZZZ
MYIKTLATVGRVSNLPTVWTNILAAAVVAHNTASSQTNFVASDITQIVITLIALSFMYIAGMFLNDAFDSNWDKNNNNMRPIVCGEISRRRVWIIGYALLFSGLLLLLLQTVLLQKNETASLAALSLAGAIILYNGLHKKFPAAAFIMGFTRFGVYIISAALLASITTELIIVACGLLLYITGVTYLARQEQSNTNTLRWPVMLLATPVLLTITNSYAIPLYWLLLIIYSSWIITRLKNKIFVTKPDVKAGIGGLLAAIPLVDGLYLASVNAPIPAIICLFVFIIVPKLHQIISGT